MHLLKLRHLLGKLSFHQKFSVKLNMRQIYFRLPLYDALPDSVVDWSLRGTPAPFPTALDACGISSSTFAARNIVDMWTALDKYFSGRPLQISDRGDCGRTKLQFVPKFSQNEGFLAANFVFLPKNSDKLKFRGQSTPTLA